MKRSIQHQASFCVLVLLATLELAMRGLKSGNSLAFLHEGGDHSKGRWNCYEGFKHTFFSQMPEEQAFSVLVKIMFDYGLRELFKQNFEDLHCKFYQLERLMQVGAQTCVKWMDQDLQFKTAKQAVCLTIE